MTKSYGPDAFGDDDLRSRTARVTICVLAKWCPRTIGGVVVPHLAALRDNLIDQVLVVAADQATAATARRAGAEVLEDDTLLSDVTDHRGPGAAIWAALPSITGQVVVFADGNTEAGSTDPLFFERTRHLACPVLAGEATLVKASFQGTSPRDFVLRVLLRTFVPDLADLRRPAAGEFAIARDTLEGMWLYPGHAAPTGILMSAWHRSGPDTIAQLDLGWRRSSSQPLADTEDGAQEVLTCFTHEYDPSHLPGGLRIPVLRPWRP